MKNPSREAVMKNLKFPENICMSLNLTRDLLKTFGWHMLKLINSAKAKGDIENADRCNFILAGMMEMDEEIDEIIEALRENYYKILDSERGAVQ